MIGFFLPLNSRKSNIVNPRSSNRYRPSSIKTTTIILFFMLAPIIEYTQAQSFTREYTYQASELDSKITSREQAIKQLKVELIEYIGVHIKSKIDIQNNSHGVEIMNHDIQALSSGFTSNLNIVDEIWDGKTYYIKASVDVYPSDIITRFDKIQRELNSHISHSSENPDKAACEKEFTSSDANLLYLESERELKNQNLIKAELDSQYSQYSKIDRLNKSDEFFQRRSELIKRSNEKVIMLKRCAAYFGHADAQFDMYSGYKNNRYDQMNSLEWLASSAKQGNAKAMYWFASEVYKFSAGRDNPKVHGKYFWWHKSALKNYPPAMYEIGRAYYKGYFYEKDFVQAEYWLRKTISLADERSVELVSAMSLLQEIQESRLANDDNF